MLPATPLILEGFSLISGKPIYIELTSASVSLAGRGGFPEDFSASRTTISSDVLARTLNANAALSSCPHSAASGAESAKPERTGPLFSSAGDAGNSGWRYCISRDAWSEPFPTLSEAAEAGKAAGCFERYEWDGIATYHVTVRRDTGTGWEIRTLTFAGSPSGGWLLWIVYGLVLLVAALFAWVSSGRVS